MTNTFSKFLSLTTFIAIISAGAINFAAAETPVTGKPSTLQKISIVPNVWITITPNIEPYKGDARQSDIDKLKSVAESSDVDLRSIVLKAFRSRLEKNVPVSVVSANGEADLQIHIEDYGLTARNKTLMQPTITIEARLIKSSGHVIWSGGENISDSEFEGISARTWQEYTANPALLKTGYEEVANSAANTIVNKLVESHKTGEIGE